MSGRVVSDDRALSASPTAPEVAALSGNDPSRGFAQQWWDFLDAKSHWESGFQDLLADEGEDYQRLGTDDYDASLEIYGATNDWRLSEAQQNYLAKAGFGKIYLNHEDGWQTHYGPKEQGSVRGWRRRYVSDSAASTTNVIAGDENNGYYEISFWPEGWDSPGTKDWLSSGYMRIVPDALDPFASGMQLREDGLPAEAEGLQPDPKGDAQGLNP